jgi:hypothetical protein
VEKRLYLIEGQRAVYAVIAGPPDRALELCNAIDAHCEITAVSTPGVDLGPDRISGWRPHSI